MLVGYVNMRVSTPLGIKVTPIVKRRGRPRGHELTTIGLPAKKAKKPADKKPCSFSRLHVSGKEEGKLSILMLLLYSNIIIKRNN